MRRLLVAVLAAALAAVGLGAAAGAAWLNWRVPASEQAEALPPSHQPRFQQATAVGGLVMVVERHKRKPVAGRRATYTIAVGNQGPTTEQVVIRAVVPPTLGRIQAEGGQAGDGVVDWYLTLPPGGAGELELTGAYRAGGPRSRHVAVTACAHDPQRGEPIVCATDVAELRSPPSAAGWWGLVFAGFALAGVVLVAARLLPPHRLAPVLGWSRHLDLRTWRRRIR